MKSKRIRAAALCLAGAVILGGCGDVPYDLTDQERSTIISYSAHIISKFNKLQNEGIKYVDMDSLADEETTEPSEEPEENQAESELPNGTGSQGADTPETAAVKAELNDLMEEGGVLLTYQGCEVKKAYIENDVYALEAPAGKVYLVLNFDLTNESEAAVAVDYLAKNAEFRISYTDGNGETKSAALVRTVLSNDFSTYDSTIESGETQQAVLLFETPEEETVFDALQLIVEVDNNKYNINL